MKIAGISQASNHKQRSLARPFVEKAVEQKLKTFGVVHEKIPELDKLWDENFESFEPRQNGEDSLSSHNKKEPDPEWVRATPREKRAMALGHTAAQDIMMDTLRYRRGWTQPTSKGQQILDSNILELRQRFGTI